LLSHVLFGKPVSTFPGHALAPESQVSIAPPSVTGCTRKGDDDRL
jgi:hypothetical protein